MSKSATIHTRISPDIKRKADSIFESLGLTTSQAVSMFFYAVVNKNGIPFEVTSPTQEEQDLAFATAIATVDGVEPSEEGKRIFKLYSRGDIDYETAQFAIERLYKQ